MPRDLLEDENEPRDLLADETEEVQSQKPSKGFLNNTIDYEKALGLGLAQGAGDVGASIGNLPADIWEHFKGEKPYHIPHPNLQQYYPKGMAGKIGSSLGEGIGQIAFPGSGTVKAVKAVNNPLMKALMGALTGGVSNAAANEDDRIGSGITGAALGGALSSVGPLLNKLGDIAPLTKSIASSPYIKKTEYMKKHGLGSGMSINPEHLKEAERLMRSEGMNIPTEAIEHTLPLAQSGEHDAIHAVQSTIRTLGRKLSKKGGVEGELGQKMHSLAEHISNAMNEEFKSMGHGRAAQLENQGKKRTAKYYKIKPYIKPALYTGTALGGAGSVYDLIKHFLK